MNKVETYNRKNILSQIKWLIKMVRYLLKKESSGGDIENIPDVSATERGVVNNEPLQELGGVDKLINGIRIGRGNSNDEDSVALGKDALISSVSDSTYNVAIGSKALMNLTTGQRNVAIGAASLYHNTTGYENLAIGNAALWSNTTGEWNTAFGSSSLAYNTTGTRNVAVGTSLFWNSTGSSNTGVGMAAGYGTTTGSYNTYIGESAGDGNGIGNYNTAIGTNVMREESKDLFDPSTFDMNNNVFIGASLKLTDGVNNTLAIDNKGNTYTDYQNALLYGNFADRFLRINGRFEIDPATMPTADNDFTKKLVYNPTDGKVTAVDDTPTTGDFIEVTEEGKTGYRLSKQLETPTHFGSIGDYAIDLTQNGTTVGSYGATGTGSVAMGIMMTASGDYTAVIGGGLNSANSLYSSVFGGYNNHAEQSNATVIGGVDNYASGNGSLVGGMGNTAGSMSEVVFGRYSTLAGGSAARVVATDRLFNIGNGSSSARSDALTILKNGLATLPSVTNTLIDEEPTGKAVVTKEWVNDFYKTIPGYDEEATQILKNINGVLTWVTEKVG